MPVQKISIQEFLLLAQKHTVLDVRSPAEYQHAHIPGAISLPLFSDEERKIVGTCYKQKGREAAIKIGLDYFGVKMRPMVEEVEKMVGSHGSKQLLVHCWRGGMRSAAVAWLLSLYGFDVYVMEGGYKVFRNWVLAQFEIADHFKVVGGYTGSGKTLIIHALQQAGKAIIDLEALAHHKGSAFGALGEAPQPKQEMFENLLALELEKKRNAPQAAEGIWLEDESQRIGNLQIPMALWYTIRRSPVYFLDIPFEARLDYITEHYGKFAQADLINAVLRIQKRLGGLETKNSVQYFLENKPAESFRILLTYYDKWYFKGLHNRENLSQILNKIPCTGVDTETNTKNLLACTTASTL